MCSTCLISTVILDPLPPPSTQWLRRNGHEAVVKLLLVTEGVDLDSKDQYGQTSLSLTCHPSCKEVALVLRPVMVVEERI
jgi:hypothetical protein